MIKALIEILRASICCSLVLLLFPGLVFAASLANVTEDIVEELAETIQLRDATVQLASDSFIHAHSKRSLPLSQALYNSFSVALSGVGAKVSAQEVGDEPMRLTGVYEVSPEKVTLTTRLRQMGINASRDLAVVETWLDRDDIADELIADNLQQAAESLVRQLEAQALLPQISHFKLADAFPVGSNHPTLRLGKAFQQAVKVAMGNSGLFGTVSIGRNVGSVTLVPSYEASRSEVVLSLQLMGEGNALKYTAQTSLANDRAGPGLLQVYDDRGIRSCVAVHAVGRKDIRPGSARADDMVETLKQKLLSEHNVQVGDCIEGFVGRKIKLSMSRTVQETSEGYGFVSFKLKSEVFDNSSAQLGAIRSSARVSRDEDRGNSSSVINKILNEKCINEMATAILIYP